MTPVDQTRFGDEGNCFAACLASILECPLESVPDPMEIHRAGQNWRRAISAWLRTIHGLEYIEIKRGADGWTMLMPPSFHVIGGKSPRGTECGHAVVGFRGAMVHDPHPSRQGILDVEDFGFFVKLFQ